MPVSPSRSLTLSYRTVRLSVKSRHRLVSPSHPTSTIGKGAMVCGTWMCAVVLEFNGESGGDVCIHVSVHADFFWL